MSESNDFSGLGQAALAAMLGLVTDPVKIKQILQLMPDNMITLDNVLAVFGGSRVGSIAFEIPKVTVNSGTFSSVRSAIVSGRIQVFTMQPSDPDCDISDGVYVTKGNYMKIATNNAHPNLRKSIIVHESVHAAHDIACSTQLKVRESEAASYIAQALYLRRCYPAALSRPNELRPTSFAKTPAARTAAAAAEAIFAPAWECAVRIAAKQTKLTATDPEYAALEQAIIASPLYSANHDHPIEADGA